MGRFSVRIALLTSYNYWKRNANFVFFKRYKRRQINGFFTAKPSSLVFELFGVTSISIYVEN